MKDKYVRKTIVTTLVLCAVLMVGLLVLLPAYILSAKMEWQGPDQGLWYCETLQMQLCFQPNVNIRSNASVEDQPVLCDINTHTDPYHLDVINQDTSVKSDKLGGRVFAGEMVSLTDDTYTVQNKAGEAFSFKPVAGFSLEEIKRDYQKQIERYSGAKTVGEAPHLEIAIQKAKALWKSELGRDAVEGEVVVAVDFVTGCWLICTTSQNTPMCVMDTKGNVIGVW